MADLDRDIRGAEILPVFLRADRELPVSSPVEEMEAVSFGEMLIVGSAGLFSAAIVALGLWKLVELIA